MSRQERLRLIFSVLDQKPPARSHHEALLLLEEAFDEIEDTHSGVRKDADAATTQRTDGRMYPPHPSFRVVGVEPATYLHRKGHKTVIAENGSFRILRRNDDLTETVVFEKRGADGIGYRDGGDPAPWRDNR